MTLSPLRSDFFFSPSKRAEIVDRAGELVGFGGERGGQIIGRHGSQGAHAAAAPQQGLPKTLGRIAQRGDESDAGDHDASRRTHFAFNPLKRVKPASGNEPDPLDPKGTVPFCSQGFGKNRDRPRLCGPPFNLMFLTLGCRGELCGQRHAKTLCNDLLDAGTGRIFGRAKFAEGRSRRGARWAELSSLWFAPAVARSAGYWPFASGSEHKVRGDGATFNSGRDRCLPRV